MQHCVSRARRSLLFYICKRIEIQGYIVKSHYRRITNPFLNLIRSMLGSNANNVQSDHIRFPSFLLSSFPSGGVQPASACYIAANIHFGMSARFLTRKRTVLPL